MALCPVPLSQTPQPSPHSFFPPFVPPRELDEEISADLADEVGATALLQLAPRLWGWELWAGGGPVGLGCRWERLLVHLKRLLSLRGWAGPVSDR